MGKRSGGAVTVRYHARRMSRGGIFLAGLALVGIGSGVGFAVRRSAGSAAQPAKPAVAAAPATVTAYDPTWCGKPPGGSTVGELRDASACGKLSLTGSSPQCLFWAECGDVRFEIDCTSGGPGRCRCDGESARTVPYDPAFCELDATSPQRSLRAIHEASALACRWTPN